MDGRGRKYHQDHGRQENGYGRRDQQYPGRYDDRRHEDIPLSNINPGFEDVGQADYIHSAYHEYGAAVPLDHREYDAASQHSESDAGLRHRWAKSEPQRDTAILLEELPSKQLEKMASELAHGSSSIRRKSGKRKSHHAGMQHLPTGREFSEEMIRTYTDDPDAEGPDDDEIKAMTMRLSDKRRLKSNLSLKRKPKTVSRWKRFKYNCSITWKHFKYNMAEFAFFLKLWRGHLKKIEGHFGTGVLSYFKFLKWLLFINIPMAILTFAFMVLPQILYRTVQNKESYQNNASFTGLELLTGTGWFRETEMYYGSYTKYNVTLIGDTKYHMRFAYLFTCFGYYLLSLIILAVSISKSYKKNYIEGSGAFDFYYVSRVFCGWDYGITAKNSANLKHKSIFNELQEYLSGVRDDEDEATLGDKCKWFWIRALTNLLILAMIGGAGYGIWALSRETIEVADQNVQDMALPLLVSGVNLVLPFFFSLIAQLESYKKPKNELYINMARTMLLKATTLGILVAFLFTDDQLKNMCRETYIGQTVYRLVIVDFIFMLVTTFFVEFIRRLFKEYCCKSFSYPEFEIGRNTLNLIYSQALCWLGTYFSPVMPIIMLIKLFLLFYVKRVSVIQNCKPSLRPWRASRAHTIFMFFLFLFFLLTVVAVGLAIMLFEPSHQCGPFQNQTSSYSIVTDGVGQLQDINEGFHTFIQIISSSGFIAVVLVVLVVLTYYMRIVMVGHKEMVELLRQQLAMEGRDKAYLLNLLQSANKKTKERSRGKTTSGGQIRLTGAEASGTYNSTAPGGRQFAKKLAETADKIKADTVGNQDNHRKPREGSYGPASP